MDRHVVRFLVDANVLSEPTKPAHSSAAERPEALGTLLARLRLTGKSMPVKDSLIAATALRHDLSLVTRNRTDFEKAGVRLVDPAAD